MLCKVEKVGSGLAWANKTQGYEIISVEECQEKITVDWRYVGMCYHPPYNPNAIAQADPCGFLVPYLPGTNIQITCPFEEKRKETVCTHQPERFDFLRLRYNYCPYCGRKL